VVRLLLSYGADPLLATYSGWVRLVSILELVLTHLYLSGQTPLMLASSKLMRGILRAHLSDAQSAAADIKPMRFHGPWEIFGEWKNESRIAERRVAMYYALR